MHETNQQTLKNITTFSGIGLHSGKKTNVRLLPGSEDQGIIFKRIDVQSNNIIEANFKNVKSANLCTTLENRSGYRISTVEHLLAAFYITGIDNAVIEIDNEEVPIMDGSSIEFLKIIKKAGLKKLNKKRKFLKIIESLKFEDKGKKISVEPSYSSFEVEFELDYKNKIIGNQKNCINFSNDDLTDVYSSRTFCLFDDIEKIKKSGLAKGGSLENAIVVSDEKIMNTEGLRNVKEFVNHKILDLAGDFLLSGHRILGKVNCYKGGHEFTNTFLRKLLKSKSSYKIIELENVDIHSKLNTNHLQKLVVNA